MAVICRFRYSPKQFTQHAPGDYVAEASDLARNEFMGQVWDDAADEGFIIHSDRLNKDIIFTLRSIQKDREGEIQSWTFVAYNRNPDAIETKVTVFND